MDKILYDANSYKRASNKLYSELQQICKSQKIINTEKLIPSLLFEAQKIIKEADFSYENNLLVSYTLNDKYENQCEPQISIVDGEFKLSTIFVQPKSMSTDNFFMIFSKHRVSYDDTNLNLYNSVPILSNKPKEYIIYLNGKFIKNTDNTEITDADICKSFYKYPLKFHNQTFINRIGIHCETLKYEQLSFDIKYSSKFSTSYPQSSKRVITCWPFITDIIKTRIEHPKISFDSDDVFTVVSDQILYKNDWYEIIYKQLTKNGYFWVSSRAKYYVNVISKIPTHPFDELKMASNEEIQSNGQNASGFYLLARLIYLAENLKYTNLTFVELFKKLIENNPESVRTYLSCGSNFDDIISKIYDYDELYEKEQNIKSEIQAGLTRTREEYPKVQKALKEICDVDDITTDVKTIQTIEDLETSAIATDSRVDKIMGNLEHAQKQVKSFDSDRKILVSLNDDLKAVKKSESDPCELKSTLTTKVDKYVDEITLSIDKQALAKKLITAMQGKHLKCEKETL